jgi:hypothetical protein
MTSNRLSKALDRWKAATIDHRYVSDPESKELLRAIEAEPTAEPEPRFKVGDRVRVKQGLAAAGKCGQVGRLHRHLTWDDGSTIYIYEDALEPIPTPDIVALARARDEASLAYVVARLAHEAAFAAEEGE